MRNKASSVPSVLRPLCPCPAGAHRAEVAPDEARPEVQGPRDARRDGAAAVHDLERALAPDQKRGRKPSRKEQSELFDTR